jgi:hypothetical protein
LYGRKHSRVQRGEYALDAKPSDRTPTMAD